MSDLSIYWNTVKYLRPTQIWSRLLGLFRPNKRFFFEKIPVAYRTVKISIPELDCDDVFVNRFGLEQIKGRKVCLLNQIVDLNYSSEYIRTLKPLIVNNLFYFEYGIALAAKYRETKEIVFWNQFKTCYEEYLSAKANLKSVYSMALHLPNVLISLDLFGDAVDADFRDRVYCELYSQYLYIQKHLETHLLANHYFEDLKALIIASYMFKDDNKLKGYLSLLKKQCEEQILGDGVHFELSLMYHKLILEDLMRIGMLSKCLDFPNSEWLVPFIQKMTDACYSLEKGIGRTPLFNDSGDNVAKKCRQLQLAAERYFDVRPIEKFAFADSGYYKIYDDNKALIIDAGSIGVDYQPAHGHCDCLSYELSIDGKPLFVNSGTFEYQGNLRRHFRTTSAHNTVIIGGHEQSQCWGGFRVARRIRKVRGFLHRNSFEGCYENYLGEEHVRKVRLSDAVLSVVDTTKSKSGNVVKSYLRLAPGYTIDDDIIVDKYRNAVCKIKTIDCEMEIEKTEKQCYYAAEFGKLMSVTCLVFIWQQNNARHGYIIDFNI